MYFLLFLVLYGQFDGDGDWIDNLNVYIPTCGTKSTSKHTHQVLSRYT